MVLAAGGGLGDLGSDKCFPYRTWYCLGNKKAKDNFCFLYKSEFCF